jgi:4'-phosphopantetheinyl transferase
LSELADPAGRLLVVEDDAQWATPPLLEEDVHIWCADLEAADERVSFCASLLTADEKERAGAFASEELSRRFVVARATLRGLLSAYLDVPARDLLFAYGEHGKPSLATPRTDLNFNISHSGDRALLAFAKHRDVGVDVERTRRKVDWEAVSSRFFEGREQSALRALAEDERRAAFFRCWTRKEAFMKATGQGVAFGLSNFAVSLKPQEPAELLWLAEGRTADWRLGDAHSDDDYAGAVCVSGRDWRPSYLVAS